MSFSLKLVSQSINQSEKFFCIGVYKLASSLLRAYQVKGTGEWG